MGKLADQPGRGRVKVGNTLNLYAEVRSNPNATWPDPTWGTTDAGIATVAAGAGNQAVVTGVAPGVALITATVSGAAQQFVVDVVANTPDSVTIVEGLPPAPWGWPS